MAGEFKTVDEQISILEECGLKIPDKAAAADFLLRNNYYRISGYSLTLRDHAVFHKGACFQDIVDIYECDHELRHILLKYIEIIEVTTKSVFAYAFSELSGPLGYLQEELFSDSEKYRTIMENAETLRKRRLKFEAYLKHYDNDLHQALPVWAFVDLLTMGDISKLYSCSPEQVKSTVACQMGLRKKDGALLGKFLYSMTIIRNLCAHDSRLYNRLFEQKPSLSRKEKELLIQDDQGIDNAHLYGFVIIMRRLLKPEDFHSLKDELLALSRRYPSVNMRHYGFRDDWEECL